YGPLPAVLGRAAAVDGVGPRGLSARRRRAPDRDLCRLLRAAAGRLVLLRKRRRTRQRRRRAPAGIPRDQLRARPALCQPPRLSAATRRLVSEGQRTHPPRTQGAAHRPPGRGASGDAAAPYAAPRHGPALGDARAARPAPAL